MVIYVNIVNIVAFDLLPCDQPQVSSVRWEEGRGSWEVSKFAIYKLHQLFQLYFFFQLFHLVQRAGTFESFLRHKPVSVRNCARRVEVTIGQ